MGNMIRLFGFASMESREAVKEFLEGHAGEGTVSDVEVGKKVGSNRAYAIVEFTTNEAAELIKSKANSRRLWFGKSYLVASDMNLRKFYNLKLNLGCQISMQTFSVLWSQENVSSRLLSDLRKFEFFLSYDSADYKLDLSYESIWQIMLYHPGGHSVKYLVIQLVGAPQISKRENYWVREIDFTPSSCIGQSSAICLELPSNKLVPKVLKDFSYYKEIHEELTLEKGTPFSCNSDLVPIINPPQGIVLPAKIMFKINSLVQHGRLPGPALDSEFFRLVDPGRVKMVVIEHALEKLFYMRECCYEPVSWLREQYRIYLTSGKYSSSPEVSSPEVAKHAGLVSINRVLVTPSKVYFCGPEMNISNRVLRSYLYEINNFIRVSFVDEDLDKLFSTVLALRISSTAEIDSFLPVSFIDEENEKFTNEIDSFIPISFVDEDRDMLYSTVLSSRISSNNEIDSYLPVSFVEEDMDTFDFTSLSPRISSNNEIDSYLPVSFVDEDMDTFDSTSLSPRISSTKEEKHTRIYRRILSVLRNGIVIGVKRFEFLAFSHSQLKENSLWMFASRPGLTAAAIREKMGDFREIRNVAKYAARLGQSFGSSREAVHIDSSEIVTIPDIETEKDGIKYVFSDGIGKISPQLAEIVAKNCGFQIYTPSAFQIRYAGYKGVVAVDPTSSSKLSLRKSMFKYKSKSTSLDILAYSKYQPCFLNRQLITLLSTLGVRDEVFERKQRERIDQLDAMLTDPVRALQALEQMSSVQNRKVLKELLLCGYKPDAEPFLAIMLQTFRASNLQDLRTKTRIFVQNGQAMMGCLDETRTLEYGQVFVQYSDSNQSGQLNIVKGKVVIAKNPCLHPGDMRVLQAVDMPALHHMVDCVVFPAKGERPHTNECSGSDLDGDIYFVCWDLNLIPPLQYPPMDYGPAPERILDRDVTMEDVQEYFVDYIVNDSLGIICNAHIVFADLEPDKAMSTPCLELAKLASIATDFSKTGVATNMPDKFRVKMNPDFMEKQNKASYESQRIIGKLYREVKGIPPPNATIKSFTKEVALQTYDPDMEVDGFREYTEEACIYKSQYDNKLRNLMNYYGIKTEAEIVSGCILEMGKSFDKKRDLEHITSTVRSLKKEAQAWFNKNKNESDFRPDKEFAKASAWYYVTYHPSYWRYYDDEEKNQDHFLSFPWCIHDLLILIKRGNRVFEG